MKSNYSKLLLIALLAIFTLGSCDKDEDNEPSKKIVKIGAQSNTTIGAFYSISENKVYTQAQAAASVNQAKIDLVCFYERDVVNNRINDMTLSSPGANITGIFTGETSVEFYTTKNLTKFTLPATELTAVQYDQLKDGDAIIATYYNSTITSGNKKAKMLAVDNIYAILTQDGTYGLFKVIEVSTPQDANGWIKFELKTYKPTV